MAQVKVYSTPTFTYCIKAKKYLTERDISFEHIDVSVDENGLAEMIKISGQMGVPVILIDDETIVGFDRERIDLKLGLS